MNHGPRLVLANASLDEPVRVPLAPLLTASGLDGALVHDETAGVSLGADGAITIGPAEVRILPAIAMPPVARAEQDVVEAAAMPRIAIERVTPSVDDGIFPLSGWSARWSGSSADLISDGHDRLAAALLWRPQMRRSGAKCR